MSEQPAVSMTVVEMESKLEEIISLMLQHQKKGEYIQAENCRLDSERLKKQLQKQRVVELDSRHKAEKKTMRKMLKDELREFNEEWDMKLGQLKAQCEKAEKELIEKQQAQLEAKKELLEKSIPLVGKESAECLNLRKMEEQSAKQRNYIEAHKIQKQVQEMEKTEKEAYLKSRQEKIEIGLAQERKKQAIELTALRARSQTAQDELIAERTVCEAQLTLKHANIEKELSQQNKKEQQATKGEMKSRGNILSPSKSNTRLQTLIGSSTTSLNGGKQANKEAQKQPEANGAAKVQSKQKETTQ